MKELQFIEFGRDFDDLRRRAERANKISNLATYGLFESSMYNCEFAGSYRRELERLSEDPENEQHLEKIFALKTIKKFSLNIDKIRKVIKTLPDEWGSYSINLDETYFFIIDYEEYQGIFAQPCTPNGMRFLDVCYFCDCS